MKRTYQIDIRSSSTRHITPLKENQLTDDCFGSHPQVGDVVIAEVAEIGQHNRFEEPQGREIIISPGNILALVLGRRYSTKEFCGEIPHYLSFRTEFDLLNIGGVAGSLLHRNTQTKTPTKLLYLGHAIDDHRDAKISTLDFGIKIQESAESRNKEKCPFRLIIVCGSEMDCGKTKTAGQIISMLSANGFIVGGGKITGTSRMKDILYMKTCGAKVVLDFMDLGYPSTSQCSRQELENIYYLFEKFFYSFGCNVLVMEIADGIFQRETEIILSSAKIMKDLTFLIMAANNSVSAYGGIHYLKECYGITPDFISGLITTDQLSMNELQAKTIVHFLDNTFLAQQTFLDILNQKEWLSIRK